MHKLISEKILAYPITLASKSTCIEIIDYWIYNSSQAKYFACANPHSLHIATSDEKFRSALLDADLLTPDGIGIVIASKILNGKITERITGSDIFYGLSELLNKTKKVKYFFLGSSEDVLTKIRLKMAHDYPAIEIVGTYSPPYKADFSNADNRLMIEVINAAKPDVLWVGMTAPKQEKWIHENISELNVKFVGPIGAVFDFYAGTVKRSHPWFNKVGLEWLPRLIQEPRRLWRRNFISNPAFLTRIVYDKIKRIRSDNFD